MRFFNSRSAAEGGAADIARPLGPEVELERHRTKLEEHVNLHKETMQHEFANLTTAVRALQRDLNASGGRLGDVAARVGCLEAQRPDVALGHPAQQKPGSSGSRGSAEVPPE